MTMTPLRGQHATWVSVPTLLAIWIVVGLMASPVTPGMVSAATAPARGTFDTAATPSGSSLPGGGSSAYAVLNESTLVLSNDSLRPGDFLASSAGLPSLETFDPQTNEIFVESFYSGLIDVISGSSGRVVATITTGAYPNSLAYDPENNNVYFGLQTYDEVSVVNASTDLIQRTVGIGFEPLAMAADPASGDLFVTGWNSTGTAYVAVLSGATGVVMNTFSFGADRFPVAGPNGIAYDPANGRFYIPSIVGGALGSRGNLTVVNAASESAVANVSLRFDPSSIIYTPSSGDFYLGNSANDNLTEFSPVTDHVVRSVRLPNTATMLAYDPRTSEVFAGLEGNVSVVNSSTHTVVATFPVLRNPSGLAFDPVNSYLYVSDYVWNNVSIVNTSTYRAAGSVLLGTSPYNMAFDAANGDLYVTDLESSQLIVVGGRSNQVVGAVPLGTTPYGIAYDPLTKDLYVDDYDAGNVSIVSGATNRVIGYLPAGVNPWGIAYDGADHDLYVTNPSSDNITVLDPANRTVVASLSVGAAPGAIAYDPFSHALFVGEYDLGNVSVYNASTDAFIRNSTTGSEPYTISIDPKNGRAFVGNYGSDNVTVLGPTGAELDLSSAAGVGVFGSVYDPADGDVYVVSFDSDLVTVVSGRSGTGVGGYSVGLGPVAAAVDPGTGTVYVANYDSDSLTLLSPAFRVLTYNVSFHESGLPVGTSWSMRFDGVGRGTSGTELNFTAPNGTLQPYSVGAVAGYTALAQFGTVQIAGTALVVTIGFAALPPTFAVKFVESGLPAGTIWSVTVGSTTEFTNGSAILFAEPNGSYSFEVGAISGFHAKDRGNFTVSGAPVKVRLAFSRSTYTVKFAETGLAAGTSWCVTFNGTTACSSTSSVSFNGIANGTYLFSVGHLAHYNLTGRYSGSVTVAGAGSGSVSNTVNLVWKP
jgi:YVTN family beta-propeller protein